MNNKVTEHVLHAIRACGSFPTVDQVNVLMEARAAVPIGTAWTNDPLWRITVGRGDRDAVVVAGVRGGEPASTLACLALASLVSEHPDVVDGWRLHIVPCLDPHAAGLNPWYGQPLDVRRYYRGFFRAHPDEQPVVAAPADRVARAAPAETHALRRMVAVSDSDLVIELGDRDTGGAWFAANRGCTSSFADTLRSAAIRNGIGIAAPPSEALPFTEVHAGVHYDEPPRDHPTTLVRAWMPLFGGGPRSARSAAEVAAEIRRSAAAATRPFEAVLPQLTVQTPADPAAAGITEAALRLADALDEEAAAPYASGGEVTLYTFRLKVAGLLLRQLAAERERRAGTWPRPLQACAQRLDDLFEQWMAELVHALDPVPLLVERVVGAHVETVLAITDALSGARGMSRRRR